MTQTNFLIGRGELLTEEIRGPKRKPTKAEAYSFQEAKERIGPQAEDTSRQFDRLPDEACPREFAVARVVLNPSYIAKSFFPSSLLRAAGWESIGSRTVRVTPEKWTKKATPKECTTTELFVAGKRSSFRQAGSLIGGMAEATDEALDLAHLEQVAPMSRADRVKTYGNLRQRHFEIGVHLLPNHDPSFIQQALLDFASSLQVDLRTDLALIAGGLWFVPAVGARKNVERLGSFAFVRVIRPMPPLRTMRPIVRAGGPKVSFQLPTEQPLSSEPRVAILDGGLPGEHPIDPWLGSYKILDTDAADTDYGVDHGLAVTSAFLFGPIAPRGVAPRPYAYADHIRILDAATEHDDPLELYRTLGLVEQVLLSRQYEFINLSLGPDLPIDDGDVHAWTSVIDDCLSDGETFMTVAIGNNGERDAASGNSRIQVPSDCVNAVAVGAASSVDGNWKRAPYSAVGPGRSPGVVKPDLMAFGGDSPNYFHAVASGTRPRLVPQLGTSFAAPYLLRSAVGARAILGDDLSPLALKALLIHSAQHADHERAEVGWGKIPEDVVETISCPPGVARVVYQGELKPGKYLRALLPLPKDGLAGFVNVSASFCYATQVDPQDAAAYTRAGLEVVFRPDIRKFAKGQKTPKSRGFFEMKAFATEAERRSDMGKWETALHGTSRMRGSTLGVAAFDIHYNARESGGIAPRADKIRYALVVTLSATRHPDLYNEVLRTYPNILKAIQPRVSLPVRV